MPLVKVRFVTEVEMDIAQHVIDRCVNNENGWQDEFYELDTPDKVAEHLAYNLGINGSSLSMLDGFADLPHDVVRDVSVTMDECEVEWKNA